ncbi:MAG: hypothetical protein MO853_03215 [Candidatus Protistobacter heckmanni]|nr:hypothetical protein [Candidatus Protistobacter heckmanni]
MEADSISAGLSSAVAGVAGRMLLGTARALPSEPVPQLIHRFWSVWKIGDAELRSVVQTALQAQDYTTLLHTTDLGSVRTALDTMDLLAGVRNRIQIHPGYALFEGIPGVNAARLKSAFYREDAGPLCNILSAKDIASYAALHKYGGVFMDIRVRLAEGGGDRPLHPRYWVPGRELLDVFAGEGTAGIRHDGFSFADAGGLSFHQIWQRVAEAEELGSPDCIPCQDYLFNVYLQEDLEGRIGTPEQSLRTVLIWAGLIGPHTRHVDWSKAVESLSADMAAMFSEHLANSRGLRFYTREEKMRYAASRVNAAMLPSPLLPGSEAVPRAADTELTHVRRFLPLWREAIVAAGYNPDRKVLVRLPLVRHERSMTLLDYLSGYGLAAVARPHTWTQNNMEPVDRTAIGVAYDEAARRYNAGIAGYLRDLAREGLRREGFCEVDLDDCDPAIVVEGACDPTDTRRPTRTALRQHQLERAYEAPSFAGLLVDGYAASLTQIVRQALSHVPVVVSAIGVSESAQKEEWGHFTLHLLNLLADMMPLSGKFRGDAAASLANGAGHDLSRTGVRADMHASHALRGARIASSAGGGYVRRVPATPLTSPQADTARMALAEMAADGSRVVALDTGLFHVVWLDSSPVPVARVNGNWMVHGWDGRTVASRTLVEFEPGHRGVLHHAGLFGGGRPTAGPPANKTQRWREYQQRWNVGGVQKGRSYASWSKTYANNMQLAIKTNAAVDGYQRVIGWGRREVTIDVAVKGGTYRRRLDIGGEAVKTSLEYKAGRQTLTKTNRHEVERDAALVYQGWDVTWVFEGTASEPLCRALRDAGIFRIQRNTPARTVPA